MSMCVSVHISAVSVEARRGRWIPGAVVTLQPELSLQLHLCLADTITPTTLRNLPVTPPLPRYSRQHNSISDWGKGGASGNMFFFT